MKKVASTIIKIVGVSLIVILVGVIGYFCFLMGRVILMGIWDISDTRNWREKTSPLDPAVISDLCTTFSIPEGDPKCKSDSVVYAPEFFGVIRRTFQPDEDDWATYDEVQEKLGKYQFRYEAPVTTADGFTYFCVWYDLRGDRIFPIVIFFYEDGRLWRLVADVGD